MSAIPDGWVPTHGDPLPGTLAWSRRSAGRCETIIASVDGVWYADCFAGGPPIVLSAQTIDEYLQLEDRLVPDVAEELCLAWQSVLTWRAVERGAREIEVRP